MHARCIFTGPLSHIQRAFPPFVGIDKTFECRGPKGAALKDFVHSQTRLRYPMMRQPGSDKFERVSWDEALDRVARLMKTDRDRNFVTKNKDGVTVNRWTTVGFLGASATTNETAYLTYKVVRGAGILAFDNQARV